MKVFLVAAVVLCIGLTQAEDYHRKRRSAQDERRSALENKLRAFLNKRTDDDTDLPQATEHPSDTYPTPHYNHSECASLTWMELMKDGERKNARIEATKDLFIEIANAALSLPPPPPFTFDDRLLKVVHCLGSMGRLVVIPGGEKFLTTIVTGIMHLASISIFDPVRARVLLDHSVKFMEAGKKQYEDYKKVQESSQTTTKRGWEEEGHLTYVDYIMRGMCDMNMTDINNATGFIRALRVIAITEKARNLITLVGEAIGEIIRLYNQNPNEAEAIAAKWTKEMNTFGADMSKIDIGGKLYLQARKGGASSDKRELSDKADELLDTLRRIAKKLDK